MNQSGFVRGRSISDNYVLAQEIIAGINRKMREGNVVFKLDMTKAYDRMIWPFLVKVLRAFGFGEHWIDMVWRIIFNVCFSVIINGLLCGFFKSTRGLCQGDPLSPALFIIGAEVLSRLGRPRRTMIQQVTRFNFRAFPIKYLRYPLYYGRRRKEYFAGLCQAVVSKVESWKNRFLSTGGRIVLLKHVLALPVYLLMAASPPKSVFKEIEGRFSNFLWGDSEWGHKLHWIGWKELCVPGEEGGMGFQRL
ncbi:uncharacterized protein LOC113758529 [Coffea eugenioides]|uniref:uncharacterized protein LOC113758529 n=1 Tax=Coffea eugenioides TaxID=49369 RepID=UPI000F60859C|nr:uncharacterized protein LOC113758529 [Coffea eugenioides]